MTDHPDTIEKLKLDAKPAGAEVLLARVTRYFANTIPALSRRDKRRALAAADDLGSVLATLEAAPTPRAPKLRAQLRGIAARRKLLAAEGGAIAPARVAELLGISRQAVGQRRAARKLLGIPFANGYVYPLWQFEQGAVLRGIPEALAALAEREPWMQIAFFLNGNRALNGKRPLDALRKGRQSEVLRAARLHGEHAAP